MRISSNVSDSQDSLHICQRIAAVRLEIAGPRGKSRFARLLGISPSTYDYYEDQRVPPADILVRIANVAEVDLRWLLTGDLAESTVPSDHPAVQRVAALLARCPNAVGPLSAFLDILEASMAFPAKGAAESTELDQTTADYVSEPQADAATHATPDSTQQPANAWIPVLGRTAAGVPHFWANNEEALGITMLSDIIEQHQRSAGRQVQHASILHHDDANQTTQNDTASSIAIITLNKPDESGTAAFVNASAIKTQYPDAFALMVDGDSMNPEFRHADIVILSPSVPATDGKPAVIQLKNQIGVTCKLFRRAADTVHLIPINEQLSPQAFDAKQLVWSLKVLARIRQ